MGKGRLQVKKDFILIFSRFPDRVAQAINQYQESRRAKGPGEVSILTMCLHQRGLEWGHRRSHWLVLILPSYQQEQPIGWLSSLVLKQYHGDAKEENTEQDVIGK